MLGIAEQEHLQPALSSGKRQRTWLQTCCLLIFAVYLTFGNLPRVLPIRVSKTGGVLLTEVILYLVSLLCVLSGVRYVRMPRELTLAIFVLMASCIYGVFINGADVASAAYTIRTIAMIVLSSLLGGVLWDSCREKMDNALLWIIWPLLGSTAIGWVIYFAFPDSAKLWAFLALYGIEFNGDPHVRRFLGSFLDPQFYSAIAVLGFICSLLVYKLRGQKFYLISSLFFVLSIIFSGSRSGVVAFVVVFSIGYFSRIARMRLTANALWIGLFVIVAIIAAFPIYLPPLTRMLGRLGRAGADPSSLHRLKSAIFALRVLSDHPLLGIGYNYILKFTGAFGGVDSSLLTLLMSLGSVGAILFLSIIGKYVAVAMKRDTCEQGVPGSTELRTWMTAYLLIIFFFSSQFNNVLLYQFWLVPTFVVIGYLYNERTSVAGRSSA